MTIDGNYGQLKPGGFLEKPAKTQEQKEKGSLALHYILNGGFWQNRTYMLIKVLSTHTF